MARLRAAHILIIVSVALIKQAALEGEQLEKEQLEDAQKQNEIDDEPAENEADPDIPVALRIDDNKNVDTDSDGDLIEKPGEITIRPSPSPRKKKKSGRSTSSSSGSKSKHSSKSSGSADERIDISGTSSSLSGKHKKSKKYVAKSTEERHGWRKWHRKCTKCPEDERVKWRDPNIKWICGAYQRARRSFKSLCMMHLRNCQDGTMFVKIGNHRCTNDTPSEPRPHGDHFLYDYKAHLSEDSTTGSKGADRNSKISEATSDEETSSSSSS